MAYFLGYFQHRRDCDYKQRERASRIATLPDCYRSPLSAEERTILQSPIDHLVQDVHSHVTQPVDILRAYSKAAIKAHQRTNCLTEVMIAEAERWAQDGVNLSGPLAGIPVSLKDTIIVSGFDASVGYSSKTRKPYVEDGGIVKLLKDAGAIPYVKTNIPTTLLSFESANDVWGRTTNPYNPNYSPGGSTGGEAALLALGGSRIGIGSDVAGSVRVPAHFSGCYSLRCATGRWPRAGIDTNAPGQEGVQSVFSPMARTLHDLTYFTRSVIQMRPWRYDHSVISLDWREHAETEYREKKVLRFGIMKSDDVVPPSPACSRALEEVASALEAAGHIVKSVKPPSPFLGLQLASRLLSADGTRTYNSYMRAGERSDSGAYQMTFYMRLPRWVKYLHYLWVRYVRRDDLWASLLRNWHEATVAEQWRLVAQREKYRATWHSWWNEQGSDGEELDVLLTVPNATPAVPHGAMKDAVSSCGYTFLFNLLDYTCGVIPVTCVDRDRDQLPKSFDLRKLNGVAQGAYKHYDATKMHGLPVGVQIVGRRLEEEKVLSIMKRIEDALANEGHKFNLIEVD